MGQADSPHRLHADETLVYCGGKDAQIRITRGTISWFEVVSVLNLLLQETDPSQEVGFCPQTLVCKVDARKVQFNIND